MGREISKPSPVRQTIAVPHEELTSFIARVNDLELGSRVDDVLAVLGKPDQDQRVYSKDSDARFLGRFWRYNVKLSSVDLVSVHDQTITLVFDESDRLKEVTHSNVDAIIVRGI